MEPQLEHDFEDVYISFAENLTFVQALRECFNLSLPNIGEVLVSYLDRNIRETMGDAFPQQYLNPTTNALVLERMAAHKSALARSTVDSASIVLLQAALDAALNKYILIIARAEPIIFEAKLLEVKVSMEAIKNTTYAELLRGKAFDSAKELGTKSLSKKAQWIIDTCYKNDCELSTPDFRFDCERLRNLDDLRHDIAHSRSACVTVENMDDLITFLCKTLGSLEAIIAKKLRFCRNRPREWERPLTNIRTVRL